MADADTTEELKPCPFCGCPVRYETAHRDAGGGDTFKSHMVKCTNGDCLVRPIAAIRGEYGYGHRSERTDDEAKQLCFAAWNCRNGSTE